MSSRWKSMVTSYKQYIFQNMFTTQIWPSHCPSSRLYWHHDRYCWRNKHVPHQFQCNAEHSTWIKHYQTGLQTCDIVLTIWYWFISVATKFLFSTARWPPCNTVVTPPCLNVTRVCTPAHCHEQVSWSPPHCRQPCTQPLPDLLPPSHSKHHASLMTSPHCMISIKQKAYRLQAWYGSVLIK